MNPEQRSTIYREKNNKSARTEMDFVRTEVARLVEAGQVVEVAKATKVTNPLSVAFKVNPDGSIKKRLIIDLSPWVNNFVKPDVYRMSRFQDALDQSDQGNFQSVYDVSKAYHHIRLHPESYKLVGFCVVDTIGKERFYHFVVVVFGLGPAVQLLGRMMRPILRFLTLNGVRSMVYLDDGRVAAATKANADMDYGLTIAIFSSAGFIIAIDKSDRVGDSSQRKEYLGFIMDTSAITVEVPQQKLLRVKSILDLFLATPRHKVRDIASVVGKLNALEPAFGRAIFVATRLATIAVAVVTEISEGARRHKNPWESVIELEAHTMAALKEDSDRMSEWNGHLIRSFNSGITLSSVLPLEATSSLDRKIPARRLHDRRAIMASNASDFAVASYSVEGMPKFSYTWTLDPSEREELPSVRELLAIERTLDHMAQSGSFKPTQWTTLWWLTDNANVEKMTAKGSGKLQIAKLVLEILRKARALKFGVEPVWVSRDNPFLQKADCLSKGIDSDNWGISEEDFCHLGALFGPFTIDLFATSDNAKCLRFYSMSFEEGALGVDSFAQKWVGSALSQHPLYLW
jgi:hypothetical protein